MMIHLVAPPVGIWRFLLVERGSAHLTRQFQWVLLWHPLKLAHFHRKQLILISCFHAGDMLGKKELRVRGNHKRSITTTPDCAGVCVCVCSFRTEISLILA